MKKLIAILLAVVVVAGGLGGFVYALTHEPIEGQKLIGYGPYGKNQSGADLSTLFTVTNPDCEREITINQVSVIKADDGTEYVVGLPNPTLQPHGVRAFRLRNVLPPGSEEQDSRFYTLEVSWSDHKKGLPLIGHVVIFQINSFDDGRYSTSKTRVPMESMKQR
ncbi:hypothetical protein ACFLUZ_03890 [Chloroflexota bacterium]